jgi:hypothetical protein
MVFALFALSLGVLRQRQETNKKNRHQQANMS